MSAVRRKGGALIIQWTTNPPAAITNDQQCTK